MAQIWNSGFDSNDEDEDADEEEDAALRDALDEGEDLDAILDDIEETYVVNTGAEEPPAAQPQPQPQSQSQPSAAQPQPHLASPQPLPLPQPQLASPQRSQEQAPPRDGAVANHEAAAASGVGLHLVVRKCVVRAGAALDRPVPLPPRS